MVAQKLSTKVIQLHNEKDSVAILKDIVQKLEDGKLDSMVLAGYMPHETIEGKGTIFRYWFAQDSMACLNTLGLIDYMKDIIRKYMLDDIDLIRGDDDG